MKGNLKKWISSDGSDDIASHKDSTELFRALLHRRGIDSPEKEELFLHPSYDQLHDPFLFGDMRKAIERIFLAIKNQELITIHGDYDADGVCSSALLDQVITDLGGKIAVYIPHREKEGYGVNIATVDTIKDTGSTLLITVDCGTANNEALEYAESLGIQVIITDHHHAPEKLPQVFALINPQNHNDSYPFGFLCGTGVAFKVAQALCIHDKESDKKLLPGYEKWLLDLVAIATIADMMPLTDENRVLVHFGLIVLAKTKRKGLHRLMEVAGLLGEVTKEITPFDIGFVIGPRLNAAGRMAHANAAYFLLSNETEDEIEKLASELEKTNQERKDLTETLVKEALLTIPNPDAQSVLVCYGQGWPIGLAGLVASRIMQQFAKPTVVMTKLPDRIAASGRSVPGFDMAKFLEVHREKFDTAGGHALACGFSFTEQKSNPQEIIKLFQEAGKQALEGKDLRPVLHVDGALSLGNVTWELFDKMQLLKPFGNSNTEPLLLISDVEVQEFRYIGEGGKHLRMKVKEKTSLKTMTCIAFGIGGKISEIPVGATVNIVAKVSMNIWNGNKELQLQVEDVERIQN